jgi:hypothetical protein
MKLIYDRSQQATSMSTYMATIPLNKFYERQQRARRYRVYESGSQKYQVEEPNTGAKHIVDLRKWECDCTNFREYEAPCCHVIIVCKYGQKDPFDYMSDFYTIRAFRFTYQRPLPPISINDLRSDHTIKPPILVKLRGRPKTKRIRKGALKKAPRICGNCGEKGHNRRSCRGQPKISGRERRTIDWLDSDDNQDQGHESGGDEEDIVLENQFSTELTEYRLGIERAKATVARLEKERTRGQESDSDLSLLEGNQFDTIVVEV